MQTVFRKKLSIVPLIIILLLLVCCEKDITTFNITENVSMGLAERFNIENQKVFSMRLVPKQNCHCMYGGELLYRYNKFGNSLNFSLLEIQIPKDCKDSYGMPYAEIDLGSLSNGTYDIKVESKSSENLAVLTITDTAYCVTMKSSETIDLMWGHFRRVLANSLWVGFCYSNDTELNSGLSFIDSLKSFGVTPTTLEYGDYLFFSYFKGKTDLKMSGYAPHYYFKEIGFVYDYNFSDNKITNLMDKFKNAGGNLFIHIGTGKGLNLYNWR
jgi:hypothetical protein